MSRSITYTTTLKRFDRQGEKTGWTYIEVPADIADKLKPGNKKEFKVKGKIDRHVLKRVSLLPMGGGLFIMPVNATMRKAIGKREGAMVNLQLQEDTAEFEFDPDFIECLNDDAAALAFYKTLPGSHQRYFSKWIASAKTVETKTKRLAQAMNALSRNMGYGEMIRMNKKQ